MRQRLASADLNLEELLSGRYVFSIPAYQRDYAWGRDEALQLVDDIAAVFDDASSESPATPYFLGTMLFVEQPTADLLGPETFPQRVDVVDGQQRLITLAILFAVLRDLAGADAQSGASGYDGIADHASELDALLRATPDGPDRTYQLRLRSADDEFFRSSIQTPGATRRGPAIKVIGDSIARRNMETVRRAIRRKFQDEYDAASRRAFALFARRHARVLVVSSNDFDYAYQIFLTINDRGKRLSIGDIFRGEILGPLDPERRERYGAVIDEMDKYMEAAEKARSKGKTFFSHLAAISGWRSRGIIEGLKRAVQQRGGPRRFAAEVFEPMAEAYLQINGSASAKPLPDAIEQRLIVLRWLEQHGDDDWIAPAMLGLVRLANDTPALDAFLAALDRFAHGLMLMGCGRDARRKHYTPILTRLSNGEPVGPAEALFALRADDQKKIVRCLARRLHQLDPPTARLVLVRADHARSGRPLADYQPLLGAERPPAERFTVEHLCPKGEIATGEWVALFPDKRRRFTAAQCIGNLALVTEVQNKAMGQHDFALKKQALFVNGARAPFALTEMLRDETTWDGSAIERRYLLIMQTVQQLWSLGGSIPKCPALPSAAIMDEVV